MPVGPFGGRSRYTPPGFTPRMGRPVVYPGISAPPASDEAFHGLPEVLVPQAPPRPALPIATAETIEAICRLLTKQDGCGEALFERLRELLRSTQGHSQPPTYHKPPFTAIPINDTSTSEATLTAGAAMSELVGFQVPRGYRGVIVALGADITPFGFDEENLIRFAALVNGNAYNSNVAGSTGGGNYASSGEWVGSVAQPAVLEPAILLRENDRFSFQARNADPVADANCRPRVVGWYFPPADPTRSGVGGWFAD